MPSHCFFFCCRPVLLGFQQRSLNFYGLSGSFLILLIVFGSRPRQLFYFLGSFFLSVLLIKAALLLRKRERSGVWIFLPFFFAALLPVLLKNFCPYSRAAASPLRGRSLSFSENYSDTGIYLQRQDPGISYRRVCRIPSFLSQSFPGAIRQLPGVPPFLDLRALCERIPPDPWQGT